MNEGCSDNDDDNQVALVRDFHYCILSAGWYRRMLVICLYCNTVHVAGMLHIHVAIVLFLVRDFSWFVMHFFNSTMLMWGFLARKHGSRLIRYKPLCKRLWTVINWVEAHFIHYYVAPKQPPVCR